MEFHPDAEEKIVLEWLLLVASTLSTLLLIYAIIWKYRTVLSWEKARGMYEVPDNLFTTNRIQPLSIELALNLIHPNIIMKGLNFEVYDYSKDLTTTYTYNSLITTLSMLRVYHVARAIITSGKYSSPRA
jgi:hypothetical protein